MSLQFLILETLLAFALIGTVITCVDNYYLEKFKRILFENALRSIIKNSLGGELFDDAQLTYAVETSQDNDTLWEVSVEINCDYPQKTQCYKKQCILYVTQNEHSKLIANDKSDKCRYIENNSYQEQEDVTGKLVKSYYGDPDIEEMMHRSRITIPLNNEMNLEKFKGVLFKNALISMIETPLRNETFDDVHLLYARKHLKREKNSIWEVSVMLENDCKLLKCPEKRCDMYVTQNKSGYITAKDKPEQCRYIGNNLDQNKDGNDREPVLTFFGDKIVEEIFQKGSLRYISEYRNHEVLSTSMINATEQRVEGETMYEVNYKLIELSCKLVGMVRDCVEDENSRIRYCKIEVLKDSHISIEQTPVMTTCAEKSPIHVVQI